MATWVAAVFAAWALMAMLFTLLLARSIRVLGGGPKLGPDEREQSSARGFGEQDVSARLETGRW